MIKSFCMDPDIWGDIVNRFPGIEWFTNVPRFFFSIKEFEADNGMHSQHEWYPDTDEERLKALDDLPDGIAFAVMEPDEGVGDATLRFVRRDGMKFIIHVLRHVRIWYHDVFIFDLAGDHCLSGGAWEVDHEGPLSDETVRTMAPVEVVWVSVFWWALQRELMMGSAGKLVECKPRWS